MNFEFSAEQQQLRETVRRFLEENAPVATVRALLDDPRGTSDAIWKGLAELGLTGVLVPESCGGAGMGMLEMGVVLEEMGRALHPGPFLSSALAAVSLIREAGTPEEQAELLPALAAGERVASVALHEAPHRCTWRDLETEARPGEGGTALHGHKRWVPDAAAADLFLVVARGPDGLGAFAVERDAPGVSITSTASVDGTRKLGELSLEGAPARRLGEGDATGAVAAVEDRVRIGLAVDGVGAAARAHELALDYARERQQFGQPIGAFQAVQHLLCDMLQDLELGRAAAYYALWAADAAPPAERHRAALMAKAFTSDAFPRLAASAIQVFGGVGYTWEYDVHLFYKRLLSLQHGYGDAGETLEELAELVLD